MFKSRHVLGQVKKIFIQHIIVILKIANEVAKNGYKREPKRDVLPKIAREKKKAIKASTELEELTSTHARSYIATTIIALVAIIEAEILTTSHLYCILHIIKN